MSGKGSANTAGKRGLADVNKQVTAVRRGWKAAKDLFTLSLQLEVLLVGCGISYDFAKAFNLVPHPLCLAALEPCGCRWRILRPSHHLYHNLHRVFRLRGSLGDWGVPPMGWCRAVH